MDPAVADTHRRMLALHEHVLEVQRQLIQAWAPHIVLPQFHDSLTNLAAYIGLRRHDLRPLQRTLACYGLSSLGRCEGHVIASLNAVLNGLSLMAGRCVEQDQLVQVSAAMERSENHLQEATNTLFGIAGERATRIMVTLPSAAADDPAFVHDLLMHGMDCVRINCAHDSKTAWLRMVRHIRRAEKQTGRGCRIFMDLAGPKLRTELRRQGPAVLHVKVRRDVYGGVVAPSSLVLTSDGRARHARTTGEHLHSEIPRIGVAAAWLHQLRQGDRISLRDARGQKRRLQVEEPLSDKEWRVSTQQSLYLVPRLELSHKPCRGRAKGKSARTSIRHVPAAEPVVWIADGDLILMARSATPCEDTIEPAIKAPSVTHFCCHEPRVFDGLMVGHALFIDDGKIRTVVEKMDEEGAWLRVQQTPGGRAKLRTEKGINVPDTPLNFGALTDKDLADLDFIAQHADIVGLSFVRHPSDIERLSRELAIRGAPSLGLVAKIETADAVRNLPEIIVHGAGRHPFGVMIARGDLAVEIGYARLAEIQEEILWLCEAAHVPVIWATQVLENLVKIGVPTRAEITDAAMSGRAECVMLNKGPRIIEALRALNGVITRMQAHQTKKTAQYRALHW